MELSEKSASLYTRGLRQTTLYSFTTTSKERKPKDENGVNMPTYHPQDKSEASLSNDWERIEYLLGTWKQSLPVSSERGEHPDDQALQRDEDALERIALEFAKVFGEVLAQLSEKEQNECKQSVKVAIAMALVALRSCRDVEKQDEALEVLYSLVVSALTAQATVSSKPSDRWLKIVIGVVIAWGTGWNRPVLPSILADGSRADVWDTRWPKAISAFVRMVEREVQLTFMALQAKLGKDMDVRLFEKEAIQSLSGGIAMGLIHDMCQCGNHPRTHDKTDSKNCGRPEHQLSRWRWQEHLLRAFVSQAVRGSAKLDEDGSVPNLLGGAFSVTTLYSYLRKEEFPTLLVGTVEYKICPAGPEKCKRGEDETTQDKRKSEQPIIYRGNRCSTCHTPFDPKTTRRVERKNMIFSTSSYMEVERWRCPSCENLVPITIEKCPLDNTARPDYYRTVHIWVYRGQGSDDDKESDTLHE